MGRTGTGAAKSCSDCGCCGGDAMPEPCIFMRAKIALPIPPPPPIDETDAGLGGDCAGECARIALNVGELPAAGELLCGIVSEMASDAEDGG